MIGEDDMVKRDGASLENETQNFGMLVLPRCRGCEFSEQAKFHVNTGMLIVQPILFSSSW